MGEIDFDGPDPIYVQAAGVLRARIQDGTYPPNRAMPSIPALALELGIAKATMQKALDLLKDEGLIRSVKGRGTFPIAQDDSES
ncbi:GntR family transcriptional regulator [Actinomadura geliboluensis]|uniref:GntR family transcriptional regulator n=1 Tax=Actinomadura geliboluensis TaxID=882440 RepID=UPI00368DA4CB